VSKTSATVASAAVQGASARLLKRLRESTLGHRVAGWLERRSQSPLQAAERALSQARYTEAVTILKAVASQGEAQAQWLLGQCYESGAGTLQNPTAAVRSYLQAANNGLLAAQARLGEIYLTGLSAPGVATDAALQRIAADTPRPTLFQQLYREGMAVQPDPAAAAHWSRKAATAGDPAAAARLAHQYASGLGLEPSLSEAEHWFLKAGKAGHATGQLGLGLLYAGHYGPYATPAEAVNWLELASNQGNPIAKAFKGVSYYPFNDAFRVSATFTPDLKLPPRVFRTSRGTDKQFYHAGEAHFKLQGKDVTLPFYTGSNKPGDVKDMSAFYTDKLTGKGAYGAGRYVDVAGFGTFPPKTITIDFNQAYNPNCARSKHFTCPVAVDDIGLAMTAGEKDPHYHGP